MFISAFRPFSFLFNDIQFSLVLCVIICPVAICGWKRSGGHSDRRNWLQREIPWPHEFGWRHPTSQIAAENERVGCQKPTVASGEANRLSLPNNLALKQNTALPSSMANQAGKTIPQSPRSHWCSWWAARHMKRRVKKRNPGASHGCSRFCDLIFKGSTASSTQDQNQQNK